MFQLQKRIVSAQTICGNTIFEFLSVWLDQQDLAVLKISEILLKYFIFTIVFSCFHGQNKYKIRVSSHCRVHTKMLIKIKVRKLNFAV